MSILARKLLLWLLSFIITYLLNTNTNTILAQPEFIAHSCSNIRYIVGSTYEKNLDTTLSTLPTTNNGFGYYNSSTGVGDNMANSIALCRGDVNLDVCQRCLNDSIVNLRQLCDTQIEAIGFYDNCSLKYSNDVIVGNTQANFYSSVRGGPGDRDAAGFNKSVTSLYNKLIAEAAAGDTLRKFATGNTTGPFGSSIYALVQCTPDLTKEECSGCFNKITQQKDWLDGSVTARYFLPMCNSRYDTYKFYNETVEAKQQPSPPILQPSPQSPSILQPSPPQPPGKKNKGTRIMIITLVIVIAIVVTIITLLSIFTRLRKKKKQVKPPPPLPSPSPPPPLPSPPPLRSPSPPPPLPSPPPLLSPSPPPPLPSPPPLSSPSPPPPLTSPSPLPPLPSLSPLENKVVESISKDIGLAEPFRYNFDSLKAATNNFSQENKLGCGGFGAVYKGTLEDKNLIAVKRLAWNSNQGDQEFMNEIRLVARLRHRNLVRC